MSYVTRLGWDADGVVLDSRATAWSVTEGIVALFGPRPIIGSQERNKEAFGKAAQVRMAGTDGATTLRAMHRVLMRARSDEVGRFDAVLDVVEQSAIPPLLITAAYAQGVYQALGDRARLFGAILGREDGAKDALIARAASDGMRWYVTDTVRDLARCRAAGVGVIAVSWGYDPHPRLAEARPDALATTPKELADCLMQLGLMNICNMTNGS
ncbi:MAG: hypothetical protein WC729_20360 [Sphingomonas sp.]|jgi:phosphoglycolate phosphatase-like HAD superfamily hydrolase|uniref:HAD family hydrolase n=1 Tax=Sphingomonas sp. TaxID=28214 RepID=UPI0035619BA9